MKRILVALDGSPRAPAVLATALTIARAQGAKITLCAVVGLPPDVPQDFWKTTDEPLLELLRQRAKQYLDECEAKVPADLLTGPRWPSASPGRPSATRRSTIEADLVVIGSHGYSGFDRLLGTTAAKVVNHATCSVLVVREPHDKPAARPSTPITSSSPRISARSAARRGLGPRAGRARSAPG